MNHQRVSSLLSSYVDGDLEAHQVVEVEAHLETCRECHDEVVGLRALAAAVAQLPRSIEPPTDLWPAIDSSLASPTVKLGLSDQTLRSLRFPLAAAALALIAVSSLVTALIVGPGEEPRTTSASPALATEGVSFIAQWRRSEDEYLRATLELVESLDASTRQLAPETVELIQQNLQIIDAAIQESRAALAVDPANRDLIQSLSSAYQKKLEVLQQVNGVLAQL